MSTDYTHNCTRDWAIGGVEKDICVKNLFCEGKMEIVKFSDIAIKYFDKIKEEGRRYEEADVRFPGILAEGVENPYNKRYRLCDGRHRIKKLINQGHSEGVFYIISNKYFMEVFNKTDSK